MRIKATEEQYKVESDTKVRHRPTGTTYWTNRYPEPVTIAVTGTNLNGGKETDDAGNEYDIDDVKAVARDLLQKLADKR